MHGRGKPRVLVQKPVLINDSIKAHCFDINEEGMYIQTDAEFRSKDVIDLKFEIDNRNISVKASVRHLEPGFGFGIRFINLTAEHKALLIRFLKVKGFSEQPLKIALLIDANVQSRAVYKARLQQDGYSVLESSTGTEAFKILQITRPDIVILDIQIEGINAYKLLQFMQTKPELKEVPAVILTTRFIPEEVDKVLALGVKDYLVKATTSPNNLCEKIKRFTREP